MKKILILVLSIALVVSGCSANNANNSKPEDANIQETQNNQTGKKPMMVPDFELESLDGSLIKLSETRDKYVILNFWYTGCPFCVKEMPDLQKLQEAYPDDLLLLTINVGETKEIIQDFLEKNKLNLNVLLDKDMKVVSTYGIRSYPTTLAINKKGELVSAYKGMLTYEQMKQIYGFFE